MSSVECLTAGRQGSERARSLTRDAITVCCIYHAPREAGESSDESSSDSSSSDDSDSEPDNSTARPSRGAARRAKKPDHSHGHDDCDHDHGAGEGSSKPWRKPKRAPSPNAYEKIPKPKK